MQPTTIERECMFTILASVLVALVVALLVYAATKPDTFRVQRSASINAPPEKIFALIEDYHRWPAWSPYEKLDPTMQRTYSGAAHGAGAVYEWEGNKKAGQGRMEITNVTPPSRSRSTWILSGRFRRTISSCSH